MGPPAVFQAAAVFFANASIPQLARRFTALNAQLAFPMNGRTIPLGTAFESFPARFESPAIEAVRLLGCLHPLPLGLWKSPARKYRRRRGNGALSLRPV